MASNPLPQWMPMSWAYVCLGAANFWRRLNMGDRLFVGLLVGIGLWIIVLMGHRLGQFLASILPNWTALGLAVYASGLVVLALNMPMMSVRYHRLYRFFPETEARRRTRICLEFGFTSLCCGILIASVVVMMPPTQSAGIFYAACSIAIAFQGLWHGVQFLFGQSTHATAQRFQNSSSQRRNRFSGAVLTQPLGKALPRTSSRIGLKTVSNPIIWLVILLIAMVLGGAIVTADQPLIWALATVSSIVLIYQLALIEPRVGNGAVLGAHSFSSPYQRGLEDLSALSLPHIFLLALGSFMLLVGQDWIGLGLLVSQCIVTIWGLWIGLVVKALPANSARKHTLWAVIGATITAQLFPPLVAVVAIGITISLTRDLVNLNTKGPALWPRP
jgi:hypothetical protein